MVANWEWRSERNSKEICEGVEVGEKCQLLSTCHFQNVIHVALTSQTKNNFQSNAPNTYIHLVVVQSFYVAHK